MPYCPIKNLSPKSSYSTCDSSQCGWWDKEKGQCAMVTLVQNLHRNENQSVKIASTTEAKVQYPDSVQDVLDKYKW